MAYPVASTWLKALFTEVMSSIYIGTEAADTLQIILSPTRRPALLSYSLPISSMTPMTRPPVSVTGLCSFPLLITISMICCFNFFSSSLTSVQICLKPVPSRCILFIETLSSSGYILRLLSSFQAEVGSTCCGSSTRLIPYVMGILCSLLLLLNLNRFTCVVFSMINHWHAFCNILFL